MRGLGAPPPPCAPPCNKDFRSQNAIDLEKVDFAKAPMTGILSNGARFPGWADLRSAYHR
jgi:hypothetical protein